MKRMIIRVLILAIATMSFGAIASAQDSNVITWGFWGSPEELATHESVAAAFMAENPDIEIEIWHQPWGDYFTKLQTLWAAGDSEAIPDVLFLFPVPSYAADGVLENLDSYIEDAEYDVEDYWPGLLDSTYFEGSVYGFPRDIGLEVLYYNKDIFDEVGIDYPTDDWTWDDFMAALEATTDVADSGRVNRYGLGMEAGKFQLWVGQNFGGILDDMENPTECTLDSPEAVEGIEFFTNMFDNNYAMRDADLGQAGGDSAVFQSGQVAMIIQNASRVPAFNAAEMNYDVAAVPIPEGGQRSAGAGGAAWVMASDSDNKEAAWTFLSWLQSTDGGQAMYTASGEILPALASTAKSDVFLGSEDPPVNREAFIIEGDNAKVGRFGFFPEWNELNGSIIGPNLERIWSGQEAAADVLPELCDAVDDFLADNGYGVE